LILRRWDVKFFSPRWSDGVVPVTGDEPAVGVAEVPVVVAAARQLEAVRGGEAAELAL
jgi:hypothetical protein